jgi:putative addiction module component (TIGR02574 family)
MNLTEALELINQLSIDERIELVQAIWDGIADEQAHIPLTEEQLRELDRRLAEHEANPDDVIPWEEVNARLRAKYQR